MNHNIFKFYLDLSFLKISSLGNQFIKIILIILQGIFRSVITAIALDQIIKLKLKF